METNRKQAAERRRNNNEWEKGTEGRTAYSQLLWDTKGGSQATVAHVPT